MQGTPTATTLDLQLLDPGDGRSLAAQLLTPSAVLPLPPIPLDGEGFPGELLQRHQLWQRLFRTTYVNRVIGTEQRRVKEASAELLAALQRLLAHPSWGALRQALDHHPALPLRIEIAAIAGVIRPDPHPLQLAEQLPWEDLPLQRPIWRVGSAVPPRHPKPGPRPWRRPRLLVVVGPVEVGGPSKVDSQEEVLDVAAQLKPLLQHRRRGRLDLVLLSGPDSNADNLKRRLGEPQGWDGLLYLGHGEPPGSHGGLLALADGSVLAGDELATALAQATAKGLALVLLSSCHSSGLAPLCLNAGVPWLLAFRGEVPDPIALAAFRPFLMELELGRSVQEAATSARQQLEQHFPGSSQLLYLVSRRDAQPLRLPLRRRRLWRLRLAQSQWRQLKAAGMVMGLGLGVYGPTGLGWANPLALPNPGNYLLDQRLFVQEVWKDYRRIADIPQATKGSTRLVVLLLNPKVAYPLGAKRVSRQVLRQLLEDLPPQQIPMVGIDIRLDDERAGSLVQPLETAKLAALIAKQNRKLAFQICYPKNNSGSVEGNSKESTKILDKAGLKQANAMMGMGTGNLDAPIQLAIPVGAKPCEPPTKTFASLLSGGSQELPGEGKIIDWSLDWFARDQAGIKVVPVNKLPIRPSDLPPGARVLVGIGPPSRMVASGDRSAADWMEKDVFPAPKALGWRPSWEAIYQEFDAYNDKIPGALVQAVLSESLRRGHWLTPLNPLPTTALGAGLGVLLAAVLERRRSRLLALALLSLLAMPLSFELALGSLVLVPLLFPLGALWATCLSRQEAKR